MVPYYNKFFSASPAISVLVYNGDVDMVCNFLGDEWFSDSLALKVLSEYRAWHLGKQVAGYMKKYENLTFATVKGSGHMVPTDNPPAALALLQGLISA